jgi:EAL domain-containing protein (putative c-di-GMP-specific phosphodiesterase class I)/FixJ family two-component response regulator
MSGHRLLVLDDDAAVAHTVGFVAMSRGFEVRSTSSAQEFFDCVERWSPTHIAVDLVMPGMDGIEILRALANAGCTARIIVMSGVGAKILEAASQVARERGLRIGGILPKPFKPAALRALLEDSPESASHPQVATARDAVGPTESELEQALREDQFVLHYQPKVLLATRRAAGVEALVRWQHPRLGTIGPERFVPMAERSARMDRLTHRITERALAWFAPLDARLSLAINISARNLDDVSFADVMHEQCRRHDVPPERVVLELTETSAMQDAAAALDILTRLRLKGFRLSIDDFGTGWSTMTQLSKLPVSELKVDRSFVASMATSGESRKIVDSTISLARSLGLATVAEGVEDAATADLLSALGCDFAQGYLFARPMEGTAAAHWLDENSPGDSSRVTCG